MSEEILDDQVLRAAKDDPALRRMLELERIESERADWSLLWRLARFARPHALLAGLGLTLSLLEAFLITLPPYAIGLALDLLRPGAARATASWLEPVDAAIVRAAEVIGAALSPALGGGRAVTLAAGFGGAVLAIWLLRFAMSAVASLSVMALGQRVVHDLRRAVFHRVLSMDQDYYQANPLGRLVNRATFDVKAIADFFSDAFAHGVRDLLFVVTLIVLLFSLDLPLAATIVGSFPLLFGALLLYRRAARPAMRTTSAVISRLNGWTSENIAGMRENHLYRAEARRRAEVHALTDAHQASVASWIRAWGLLRPAIIGLSAVVTAGVLWLGYERALAGAISVGLLLTFLRYTTQLWAPIRSIAEKFTIIQAALTSAERIVDVLNERPAMTDAPGADPKARIERGRLAFEEVSFAYPRAPERPVLRGLSFEAEPGETIALVGDTGAGKSTVAHLVSRFYNPDKGRVLLDGRDARSYTLGAVRRASALVPQDVTLFADTVRENVALGLEIDDEAIERALRAVGADDLLARLAGGLDHVLDEGGRTLSAGERQLISFARALVFDPPILVLDEATANVDSRTEAAIQRGLAAVTRGRTSLIIAHRLSTVRDADQILVMRHGEIVERGHHDELVERGGEYARLVALHEGAAA